VSSVDFPGNFNAGTDAYGDVLEWSFARFQKEFQVVISSLGENDIEFDLIGIDASIANAFRRILISEVPTMAIETVYVMNNTSIMHDEILAHRLGLVPIKADPRMFEFKEHSDDHTDDNTIVFELNIKCEVNPNAKPNAVKPSEMYKNSDVLSKHLIWEPQGIQGEKFSENPIRPVLDDIVLTKLRPGQEISLQAHCQKGIGKEHAKWSPVATASYRLLPHIEIIKPIIGASAERFRDCFPPGVVELYPNDNGEKQARILNPRKDTVSREVLRHKEFEGKVKLTRIRDHFIFSIESTGVLPPHVLFDEALQVLANKCRNVKDHLQALLGAMEI
ncbi:DNA-directed RNA polymerases I and III subunit RPAC1, partial [Blyttiomyces sp. JEL0837]